MGDPASSGAVVLAGEDIAELRRGERREAGIGFIPEDRHRTACCCHAPLWENSMLGHQTRRGAERERLLARPGAPAATPSEIVDEYDVRTPGMDVSAGALSGGNQQKLIVGREILATPTFLIAAHPTRASTSGPRPRVGRPATPGGGLATLLISADLDELIGLSDTLLVLYGGRWSPSSIRPRSRRSRARRVHDRRPRHGMNAGRGGPRAVCSTLSLRAADRCVVTLIITAIVIRSAAPTRSRPTRT